MPKARSSPARRAPVEEVRIGPTQLVLLSTLALLPESRARSIEHLIAEAPLPGGRTSAQQSIHRLAGHGWIELWHARTGYECVLTESGRVIAEGRVPLRVIGQESHLRHHGLLPPDGRLDS